MPDNALYPYRHWLVIGWLAAFVAFHSAWTSHKAAAFTLNAFDLAEQVGIHPAIRAETPPLRTAGLLWFALPLMAGGIGGAALLYQDAPTRWALRGLAAAVALRVIPPEHALRAPRTLIEEDYSRQLLLLTLIGLGLVALTVLVGKTQKLWIWETILCGLGIVLPLIGFKRAFDLLHELQLDVHIGAGMVIYVVVMVVIGGMMIWKRKPADDLKHPAEVVFSK